MNTVVKKSLEHTLVYPIVISEGPSLGKQLLQ